jgi:hypothetical protein
MSGAAGRRDCLTAPVGEVGAVDRGVTPHMKLRLCRTPRHVSLLGEAPVAGKIDLLVGD